jgi:hypothetical protein
MTVFGKNLWWSMWSFYLPFVASLLILNNQKKYNNFSIFFIFIAVFIKCLYNGYEYITTTLLMMLSPYIYYSILESWKLKYFFKKILSIGVTSISSVLLSVLILSYQISTVTGSFKNGLYHIFVYSLCRRTYGDPDHFPAGYAKSLNADTINVVHEYLKGFIFDFNNIFNVSFHFLKIPYIAVIFFFFILSCLVYLSKYYSNNFFFRNIYRNHRKLTALSIATWFSCLAPLSWFIIFKAHSYFHTHMNYIVWHMPFTLFGFALSGSIVFCLVSEIFDKLCITNRSRANARR